MEGGLLALFVIVGWFNSLSGPYSSFGPCLEAQLTTRVEGRRRSSGRYIRTSKIIVKACNHVKESDELKLRTNRLFGEKNMRLTPVFSSTMLQGGSSREKH